MDKQEFTGILKGGALKEGVRMSKKEGILQLIRCVAFSSFGFLLGMTDMLFDTSPLGFALLAASSGEALFVLLGLIASAFDGGELSLPLIGGACLITACRVLSSLFLDKRRENAKSVRGVLNVLDALFSESAALRVMSAAVGVFLIGVMRIAGGGFRFYDLFASIFYLIATPVSAFLFSNYFIVAYQRKSEGRAFSISPVRERLYHLSILTLFCALVFSAREMSFAGISVPLLLSLLLTLYATRRGFLYGIVAGLLLGLSLSPYHAPMLALCALAYASISKLSLFGGAIASCIVGLAFGLCVRGVSALALDFPALLCAPLVFCSAERFDLLEDVKRFFECGEREVCGFEELTLAEQRMSVRDERLRSISDSFSSLSEIFYNLSSRLKRPSMLDLHSICEESFERHCESCERRESCFGEEYPMTLEAMKRTATQLHSFGRAEEKKLPEAFRKKCPEVKSIVKDSNAACSIATKRAFQNEKTEIFALDYDAVAAILNDAIAENEGEFKTDVKLGKKIARAIADAGYGEHSVTVFGKRKLKIIARDLEIGKSSSDIQCLMRSLEEIAGVRLSEPTFELSFGSVNMSVEAVRSFSAECAFASSASENESVCGDTVSIFENADGYLYALISDGMGTGKRAALASEICNAFLRNMLSAGNKMETSLRMLNSVLRANGSKSEDECSATVDLLQLDTYSGALTLVKSGAAPTLVLRRENVFKLSSPSFPIGILRSTDAKQLSLSCEDGDLVVMVSDGAVTDADNCDYIADFLREKSIADEPVQKIADRLLRRARAEAGENHSDDDISVVVLRVKKDLYGW